jgi:tripartite-type tricarboxylate transporter receptor subunit TctC
MAAPASAWRAAFRPGIARVAGMACLAGLSGPAAAQAPAWPSKAVRFLVGFAPGGGTDIMARAVAVRLADALGQQVVVENRPGANANLAAEIAAKAPPDGYTVLFISVSHAVSKSLYRNLKYDLERDFIPLAGIGSVPQALVVNPSLPVKSVKDLVALARAHPGKLNYGTTGVGGGHHLRGEQFMMYAGVKLTPVAYRGGAQAQNAQLAGEIEVMFDTVPTTIEHVQSRRLRALAIMSGKPVAQLPGVPTLDESGYKGFDASGWMALVAPAKTPPEILARLNKAVNAALATPDLRSRLEALGLTVAGGSTEALLALIRREIDLYARIVKASGLELQ